MVSTPRITSQAVNKTAVRLLSITYQNVLTGVGKWEVLVPGGGSRAAIFGPFS
jgi:hypothetical protein